MSFQIRLKKQKAKFSSTHFTIFSETSAERLHGHNYQIEVLVDVPHLDPLDFAFDFNALKPLIELQAKQLDERVLIAELNPFIRLEPIQGPPKPHTRVLFADRCYQFPDDEAVLLPVRNITSEALARYICQGLIEDASAVLKASSATRIEVTITETAGQSATYSQSLNG